MTNKVIEPARALSKAMIDAVPHVVKRIINNIERASHMPQPSRERLVNLWVTPEDQAILRRASELAPLRVASRQQLMVRVPAQSDPRFMVIYRYQISNYRSFLPDGDEHRGMLDHESQEYKELQACAENSYQAEFRAAHYYAIVTYIAHACHSPSELKFLWPSFAEPYRTLDEKHVQSWVRRFDKARPSSYVPRTFPGIGEHIEEAQRSIGMMLALGHGIQQRSTDPNLDFDNFNRKRPRIMVPWAEHIPDWMTEALRQYPLGSSS